MGRESRGGGPRRRSRSTRPGAARLPCRPELVCRSRRRCGDDASCSVSAQGHGTSICLAGVEPRRAAASTRSLRPVSTLSRRHPISSPALIQRVSPRFRERVGVVESLGLLSAGERFRICDALMRAGRAARTMVHRRAPTGASCCSRNGPPAWFYRSRISAMPTDVLRVSAPHRCGWMRADRPAPARDPYMTRRRYFPP